MIVSTNVIKSINARTADVCLRDDDIICVCVKDDVEIELVDSKETFEAVKKLANGDKKPVLVFTGSGGTVSDDVKAFSASDEAGEPTLAEAVIAKSLAHLLLVNFLIRFTNITRPIKLFKKESAAVAWLNKKRKTYSSLSKQ